LYFLFEVFALYVELEGFPAVRAPAFLGSLTRKALRSAKTLSLGKIREPIKQR
jgi:hypothetical protein